MRKDGGRRHGYGVLASLSSTRFPLRLPFAVSFLSSLEGACMLTYELFSCVGMCMMPGMGRGAFNGMPGMGSRFGMQGHFQPSIYASWWCFHSHRRPRWSFPPDDLRRRFRVDESGQLDRRIC